MNNRPEYFDRYETIAFDRTESGVLTMRIHTNGGPVVYRGALCNHKLEWLGAFRDIGADKDNKVVIITGTGDQFISEWKGERLKKGTAHDWDRIYWEGKHYLRSLLDIEAPMIAAINGPTAQHSELALLCDITLASENAFFQDTPHLPLVVPGDGVAAVWMDLLGPNRGRYFLLTRQKLTAREALELGVVNEVLPPNKLMSRAMELAEQLAAEVPPLTARYTRLVFTQRLKRIVDEASSYGLAVEGLGWLGMISSGEK